jgi:hypothetical protein
MTRIESGMGKENHPAHGNSPMLAGKDASMRAIRQSARCRTGVLCGSRGKNRFVILVQAPGGSQKSSDRYGPHYSGP